MSGRRTPGPCRVCGREDAEHGGEVSGGWPRGGWPRGPCVYPLGAVHWLGPDFCSACLRVADGVDLDAKGNLVYPE